MKQSEIAQLFPAVFQRTLHAGNPLTALLEIMETLQAADEAVLARVDAIFDPRRTFDRFVPYLAYWVDLTRLFDNPGSDDPFAGGTIASGLGRLRELIASAAYLSQWRGTKKGLLLFLQTATGLTDFEIMENVDFAEKPRQFHLGVRGPREAAPYRELIERIVELEKPAYVTYELSFKP
jgi:phage tail-like protein